MTSMIDLSKALYDHEWADKDTATRAKEHCKLTSKYPDRVPVVVTYRKKDFEEHFEKTKQEGGKVRYRFLLPHNLTCGQFIHVIRKRIKLNEKEALFLYVQDYSGKCQTTPAVGQVMRDLSHGYAHPDTGFLHIHITKENTYG